MASKAAWAKGTKLYKGGIGGTAIGELTNINGLSLDTDEIDVTNHDSEDAFEEVIQGIKRTGVVSLEGNFIPDDAGQEELMADYLSGAVDDYAIVFPSVLGAVWNFKGFVKKAPSTEAPVEGKVPFTAEIRVTGKPSLDVDYSGGLTDLTGIQENTGAALTFIPAFNNAKYTYNVAVNTASTWVKVTPTAAAHTITVNGATVTSGVQSGELTLGAANTITTITIEAKATGKIARVYRINVARP